jgi:uncharacterized protein YcnI
MRAGIPQMLRPGLVAGACLVALVALVAGAAPAAAHIQVLPATAAPDDAVEFEVLVPNERDRGTTKVELAVPPGVIPFSYLDAPGWKRSLTLKQDGSTRSIVWKGKLRKDGFASFSFLASTPGSEGEIAWKAIQTYEDGKKVRWIEPAQGESPAAITKVSKQYPPQNAGGENAEGSATPADTTTTPATATESASSSDDSDGTARWLAIGGLVAGVAALVLSIMTRASARARKGPEDSPA